MGATDPATRQDLATLENKIENRMTQMQDALTEAMRDMQTEVLRAFHNWARPTDIKLRSH
jgi:hypothetical protein